MKRKNRVLLTIFLAAGVLTASAFAVKYYAVGEKYRRDLEYSYARSLGDLTDTLEQMQTALERSRYCSTPTMQHKVSAAVISCGGSAKAAVSYLPFHQETAAKLERLLSCAEDYALYTGRKLAAGGEFSEEDRNNFQAIGEQVERVSEALSEIRLQLGEGQTKIGKTERLLNDTLELPEPPAFDESLSELNEEEFPELLYDGPFSDHIRQKKALFLEGKEEISREKAIEIAAEFLERETGELKCENQTEGALAAFQVRGDGVSANVTAAGGEISWAKKVLEVPEAKLGYEEALEKAREFLERAGVSDVKERDYIINDNTCTMNFHATQDGVLLYPDLIKIVVELNEGGVVEYEATGYLMNHREREKAFLTPALSREEAEKRLSGALAPQEAALAVIFTEGENEVLTYEFLCRDADGAEVLAYLNAETGLEEQVYLIDRSETGILLR